MYERFGQSEYIRIISEASTSRIVARHVNRCQWIQLRTHRDGFHKFLPTKVLWEKVLLQITAAPKWFYEAHYLQLRICAIGFKHPRSWSLISFDVSLGLVKGIKYACTFYLAFLCNVLYHLQPPLQASHREKRSLPPWTCFNNPGAMLPRCSRKVGHGHKWMVGCCWFQNVYIWIMMDANVPLWQLCHYDISILFNIIRYARTWYRQ